MCYKIKTPVFLLEQVFSFRGKYVEEVKQKFVAVYPECDVPRGDILQHFIKSFEELDQLQ